MQDNQHHRGGSWRKAIHEHQQYGGIQEDFRTYEMRHPLTIATTGLPRFNYGHQLHFWGLSVNSGSPFAYWLSLKFQYVERFLRTLVCEAKRCKTRGRRGFFVGCLVVYEEKRSRSFEASTLVFSTRPLLFDSRQLRQTHLPINFDAFHYARVVLLQEGFEWDASLASMIDVDTRLKMIRSH